MEAIFYAIHGSRTTPLVKLHDFFDFLPIPPRSGAYTPLLQLLSSCRSDVVESRKYKIRFMLPFGDFPKWVSSRFFLKKIIFLPYFSRDFSDMVLILCCGKK